MILHKRRWCPVWVGILAAIATAGLSAVAVKMESNGWEMVPLVLTMSYLTLTLLFNVTTYTLSREGLQVREGVIPAGFRDRRVARGEIRGGYWRYNYRVHRSGEDSHWAAGVATADGDWIDSSPRYATEEEAREAAVRLGRLLELGEVSRVTGEQPKRDFRVLGALSLWFGLVLFCLTGPLLFSL